MQDERTALVLGAGGGIGGAMVTALQRHGWRVRAFQRRDAASPADEVVRGDAMDAQAVMTAARGVSAVVHAVNPPGYRDWNRVVLPMLDNSIAAARAAGATLLLPGTIYNYGPDAWPLIREDAAQNPLTRKGRIRVAMEERLRAAAGAGLRAIVVRAGDFFGPGAGNSWLAGMLGRSDPPRGIMLPGVRGVGHSWAYLPDLAEAMALVLGQDLAAPGLHRFHFAGHWDADGTAIPDAVDVALGRRLPRRRLPWGLMRLASPFHHFSREVSEIRPLWQHPVRLDNSRLVALLGAEPRTDLATAMRATLQTG